MPSEVKVKAEEPPIGRFARWTVSLGTLKNWPTQTVGVGRMEKKKNIVEDLLNMDVKYVDLKNEKC